MTTGGLEKDQGVLNTYLLWKIIYYTISENTKKKLEISKVYSLIHVSEVIKKHFNKF